MNESPQKKWARWCATGCTLLYLALFFPSFYIGLIGSHIANSDTISGRTGTIMVFASVAVPFSLIFCIFLLWRKYFQERFQAMYIACIGPFIVALLMWLLMRLLVI